MQVIPAVDVLGERAVRLLRGDYDQATVYGDDPVARCLQWQGEGASLVHVVDLDGARTGVPDRELWAELAGAGAVFQIGGGIRTPELAEAALAAGAERVVMGTAAVWDPGMLARVARPERVVAAVDVRDGRATGAGWLDGGRDLAGVLDGLAAHGVERLLVTGITRDGTMEGPEIRLLSFAVDDGRFSILASGGVGDLDDIRSVRDLGCEAVIVGRALYERRFTLSEAMAAAGHV